MTRSIAAVVPGDEPKTAASASTPKATAPEDTASPAAVLRQLEQEYRKLDEVSRTDPSLKPDAPEAAKNEAHRRYQTQVTRIAQRALELAKTHNDPSDALPALTFVVDMMQSCPWPDLRVACDEAYDLLAKRYANNEKLLPMIRVAWNDACMTTHAESFLRTLGDISSNRQVKGLALFTLGRHHQELLDGAADLDHPVRGAVMLKGIGAENFERLQTLDQVRLRDEAASIFERVQREFADVQPWPKVLPALGEQSWGSLFRLRGIRLGEPFPFIGGEDLSGKPLNTADFRGKVIAVSCWATWCGPCMGMVPMEKTLVERMKDRPFVLVGINGDNNRAFAAAVAAKQEMNWRSLWDGGIEKGLAVKLGVSVWPTVFLIDSHGTLRDASTGLRGDDLEVAVEALVKEAEAAQKAP